MVFSLLIYAAMAVLCLLSLVGFRGHGLFAMKRAGTELERQGNRLKDQYVAEEIRQMLQPENLGSGDTPIQFRNKVLREAMTTYCADIRRMYRSQDMKGESKYQRDIENYIHMDLLEHLGNSTFVEYVCSGLTGLGILGTFIGMTRGLMGFNAQDADNALQSIAVLTEGMKYAFTTSIWGIVLSLGLGMFHKCIRHDAERKLNHFLDAFRDNIVSDQHEVGYNQLLRHLSDINRGLDSKMNSDMSRVEMFANQFVDRLAEKLELNIGSMREAMEQVNTQQQIFAASVQKFGDQVEMMGREIRNVSEHFDKIIAQSEALAKNLEQSNKTIGNGVQKLREMVEADSAILENNRELSEQLMEKSQALTAMVDNVNAQSRNTADVIRKLSDYTASAVNETAAGCNKLVEKHYGELKGRMVALMNVAENQTVQVRNAGVASLEEVRAKSNSAISDVQKTAHRVVLEMPQTRILKEELDTIVENQNELKRHLDKRNSMLFAKLIQALRRDEE